MNMLVDKVLYLNCRPIEINFSGQNSSELYHRFLQDNAYIKLAVQSPFQLSDHNGTFTLNKVNNLVICEISGSRLDEYENDSLFCTALFSLVEIY
jgi:hypothetical protein